jgi:hypothetical protein
MASWSLLHALFDGLFEACESATPKLIKLGPELVETFRVDLIDAAVAVWPVGHEAGVLEHLEVLRHRGPTHRELAGKLADGARPACEPAEDRSAGAIAER